MILHQKVARAAAINTVVKQWTHWMLHPLPETVERAEIKDATIWEILRHMDDYKDLALIARDLLCCPDSEAAVERLFSAKRRAINDFRPQMKDETLTAKLLWLSRTFRQALLLDYK